MQKVYRGGLWRCSMEEIYGGAMEEIYGSRLWSMSKVGIYGIDIWRGSMEEVHGGGV